MVGKQLLNYCKVTVDDINRADLIYGSALPLLQGKMVRHRPEGVRIEHITLPLPIATNHKNVQLYVDFFFVNGYPFLATKSKKVNYLTATPCKSRSKGQIIEALEALLNTYESRGFNVTVVHGDNEFNIKDLK